jgi:hypothetical protein
MGQLTPAIAQEAPVPKPGRESIKTASDSLYPRSGG